MIGWGFFPSRLQWAAECFKYDPAFAAQAYRLTQACPSDPQTAQLCLELACCWASENPEVRAMVPGLPPLPLKEIQVPYDVLDHWLDWQRHLGRHSGRLMEMGGFVILGEPLPAPVIYCGHTSRPNRAIAGLASKGVIQIPAEHHCEWLAHELDLEACVSQQVAIMPTLTCAKLPRELPEGFRLERVETSEHVLDYQDVTRQAYAASYGPAHAPVALLNHESLLGHADVQAWIIYQGDEPVRVISGFVSRGIVGAHAGAAVPSIRGRHFSEPLLATVATWGHMQGASCVAGICMPQAVPILARIGATIVDEYVTYRRRSA